MMKRSALTLTAFGLSLSKAAPFFPPIEEERGGLRQAQPKRVWFSVGGGFIATALAACQAAPAANNQAAATPTPAAPTSPAAVAERLVRQQAGAEARIVAAQARRHEGVVVICGAYEQGGRRHRYIVVNAEQVWLEPNMSPGEMPRAVNEFCAEGGRA